MNDLSYINEKINEYTGGANNFKRGLILDENPEVDDEIHITAIATGFLFNNLIGPDINLGRIIMIDKDFVYDKEALSREDGLSLNADSSPHIGYNSDNAPGTFRYDPDRIPDLLIRDGQNISNLEMVPAIQRNKKN